MKPLPGNSPLMGSFVEALFKEGNANVQPGPIPPMDKPAWDLVLAQEQRQRHHAPGTPPAFDPASAEWAFQRLYGISQLVVCREMGTDAVHDILTQPCPAPISPSTHWSVDLALRFLPDAGRLAMRMSPGDPLNQALCEFAAGWPLSSVGMGELESLNLAGIMSHPSLRQVYIDRVIEKADTTRLNDLEVREAVRAAIGAHPELAPGLSQWLAQS
ncbi:MAG: hypothetical protein FJ405_14450 [Verrucomicrobia bacterium]|nr:hypothetical protein [Verrucomicrobiota bacterium]